MKSKFVTIGITMPIFIAIGMALAKDGITPLSVMLSIALIALILSI